MMFIWISNKRMALLAVQPEWMETDMPLALSVILILLGLGLIWLIYTLFWGTPPSLNLAVERLGL
ncbi:MAG TPA: hypothetical protein DF984_02015, partial [Anaerolineaceae bacterium]|nr:hypothetical protein [Anaerolineaceae bacterium]